MTQVPETGELKPQVGTSSLQEMQRLLEEIGRNLPSSKAGGDRGGPRIEDLRKLLEISQAINSTLDLDRILAMVMNYAIELVSAERGFIMLVEDSELVLRQSHNLAPEHFGREGDRFSRTIANRVIETGESIYTSDALEDPRFVARESVMDLHLRSIMGVPLKHQDAVIGLIYLDNSSEGRIFLQADLYILELLAQEAAIALANARLLGDVHRLREYADHIIASTPVALLVLDRMGRVERHNERGGHLLAAMGAAPDDTPPWLDLIKPSDREVWGALLRSVLDSGNAHSWSRHVLHVGEEQRTFRVLASPLRTGDDTRPGIVLTLDDITESEQMREELAKAAISIQKADQIGDVAHEMNNFLTVIYNQAQIFEHLLAKDDKQKLQAGVPRILDAAEKLSRLVEALLRPDRMDPQPKEFQLKAAIDSLRVVFEAERRFDRVEFRHQLPPDLPDIRFDPVHLELILYNLCKNAAEAMEDAGTAERVILIRAERGDREVRVQVEDSGPGLPAERRDAPWELRPSTKAGGHGRGLHNAAVFAEKNGGRIALVKADTLGGAAFCIWLPASER